MVPSSRLQQIADLQLFGDKATLHGLSRPVLFRQRNSSVCVAMFLTVFSLQSFDDCLFDRPETYILTDIDTGEVLDMITTKYADDDFSDAVYARRYNLCAIDYPENPCAYYNRAFMMLDDVRKEYISAGTLNMMRYHAYQKRILRYCPVPYRRFFRELSI